MEISHKKFVQISRVSSPRPTYFAQFAALVQIQIRFERFARKEWQFHQFFVQKDDALHHHIDILQNGPRQMHFANFHKSFHQFLFLQRIECIGRPHFHQTQLRILRTFEKVQIAYVPIRIKDFLCSKRKA